MSEDLTKKLPQSDSERGALILATLQALSVRIDTLEESRYDTGPIWQKSVADIAQLHRGMQRLEEVFQAGLSQINTLVRDLDRRFGIFNDTLVRIQADNRDIYDRVRSIEHRLNPPNNET